MSRKSSNTDIPKKSIIKKASTSSGRSGSPQNEAARTKTARFDEDNIKETYRPADKDYGFEEITEAKTPFEREGAPIDPNKLRERLMDFTHESDDDDDQLGCRSSNDSSDSKRDSAASGSSSTSAASKTSVVSASLSIASGSSLSFEERRKKHIQAEFVLAKQASIPDVGDQDQDLCTKPE